MGRPTRDPGCRIGTPLDDYGLETDGALEVAEELQPGGATMKYLCLVYAEENKLESVSDAECVAYDSEIRDAGRCVASEALEPVATATTLRVRNGRLSITDGPFAETKEQLAGFYMIEARDLNEAIQVAAKIPPARVGSVEVRPVRPIREAVLAASAGNETGRDDQPGRST